jgi:hypothetical protein
MVRQTLLAALLASIGALAACSSAPKSQDAVTNKATNSKVPVSALKLPANAAAEARIKKSFREYGCLDSSEARKSGDRNQLLYTELNLEVRMRNYRSGPPDKRDQSILDFIAGLTCVSDGIVQTYGPDWRGKDSDLVGDGPYVMALSTMPQCERKALDHFYDAYVKSHYDAGDGNDVPTFGHTGYYIWIENIQSLALKDELLHFMRGRGRVSFGEACEDGSYCEVALPILQESPYLKKYPNGGAYSAQAWASIESAAKKAKPISSARVDELISSLWGLPDCPTRERVRKLIDQKRKS